MFIYPHVLKKTTDVGLLHFFWQCSLPSTMHEPLKKVLYYLYLNEQRRKEANPTFQSSFKDFFFFFFTHVAKKYVSFILIPIK